ncbi:hypothetical protein [Mesorhizobium sp. M1A.F.Ca.IN.020.04.1.1]|uniref:hypothetical protein n=1 Tax=Mesorhizobium sp. M1A.F.Ca.IN.020.04.1.1 TaxID=2496761 RepID=UPI000FCBCEA2|nr:hypothetical protein [Mesorhizobium sp. M1A.F.Ca.IN.020.04.1.1]RUW04032.1 hypothetical protein EOA49_00445 [Mesorhizobium sp. M1A.F.Ca.IN.020.04.1.1]RUW04095.1 hypothetical protein EOA49_00780 [Mesorhizobium sp. M1A.F.Ca.IN.020.04.1.1]
MSLEHRHAILDALLTVLDEDHALAVMEHRRITIRKPLTAYAARLLAKRFAEYGDANAAADIMIERNWQGFNIDWLRRRQQSGKRNYVDVAKDRWNGSAGIYGNDGDAQCVPSRFRQPGSDDGDLREIAGGPFLASRH